ncbi:MAG: hypothetical protein DRN20_06100 [Thermoplasmata archaeon]|nr:MAG: hypothetical protein DRN20_06100 [Thermoplasmata archaeon]
MSKGKKIRKQLKPERLIKRYGWVFHVLFGIATVIAVRVHPILPLIFFLTFVLYELDEEWYIGDHAFEELREYGAGLFLGLILAMLL